VQSERLRTLIVLTILASEGGGFAFATRRDRMPTAEEIVAEPFALGHAKTARRLGTA
jgi:hypothetical protein